MSKICQTNNYVLTSTRQMELWSTTVVLGYNETFYCMQELASDTRLASHILILHMWNHRIEYLG